MSYRFGASSASAKKKPARRDVFNRGSGKKKSAKKKGTGFRFRLRHLFVGVAIAALPATGAYRLGTEKTTEARLLSTVEGTDGKTLYLVTDNGTFKIAPTVTRLGIGATAQELKGRLRVGATYHIESYGWGRPNVTELVRAGNPVAFTPVSSDPEKIKQTLEPGARFLDDGKGEGHKLTPAEEKLFRAFFGDLFDPSKVRLYFHRDGNGRTQATTTGHTAAQRIDFFTENNSAQDYTAEAPSNFGLMFHEILHAVQQQNGYAFTNKEGSKGYAYVLTADSKFTDFGAEQQAAIIENYARRFLHPLHAATVLYEDGGGVITKDQNGNILPGTHDTAESDMRLADVVEEQFPAAGALRLANEGRNRSVQQVRVAAAPALQR